MTTTTDVALGDPAPPAVRDRRGGLFARLAVLFPTAPMRVLTRRDVLLGTLLVVAAAVVSMLRITGTGALQSIWQEDANEVLTEAYYRTPAKTIISPLNGYFTLVPRLLGVLAAFLPVSWAAAVLSISAALVFGLMVLLVYVASGAHLSSPLARVVVTAPLVLSPMAENLRTEVYARPVCLHLFALYVLFWVVLWAPVRRAAKWIAITTAFLAAMSTLLTITLIPLALMRVVVRRDRTGWGILGSLLIGAAGNAVIMAGGGSNRQVMYPEPLVALWDYVVWGVPGSVLGYRATEGLLGFHFPTNWQFDVSAILAAHIWVILLSWVVVLAVFAVAATRRFTRPAWLLAAVAFAHSIAMFCFMVMAQGNEPRYLVPVELLVFAGLAVLLLPRQSNGGGLLPRQTGTGSALGRPWSWRANAPLLAFAILIAVVSAFNFRWDDTYRSHAPLWTEQVRKATIECKQRPELKEVLVRSAPEPWGSVVSVPCHRLTEVRPWDCVEPRCAPINGLPPLTRPATTE